MSELAPLQSWLEREQRAAARGVSLDEALLGGRGFYYAAYRLRYALPRAILRCALHALEVVVVAAVFRFEYVAPLIAIRSALTIGGALWWGALEGLRVRVRQHATRREWQRARIACEAWLSYSVDLCLLLLLGLFVWLRFGPWSSEAFGIFDAFAIAGVLRLMLESVARTYHAGVFALKRVYRPLWSVLVPDVLEVAAVIALLPLLGLWSLSVVALWGGLGRVLLTFHYSRRAYQSTRLPPPRWLELGRARRKLPLLAELGMARHAAANLASRIDAVLVMALLASSGKQALYLAVTFHLLQPLFAASQRWAGFFYLDFLTLRLRKSEFLERRFRSLLLRSALGFALIVVGIVAPLVVWLKPDFPRPLLGLLCVFLMLRSYFGLYQVRAFALHQHGYLVKLSVGALVAVALSSSGLAAEGAAVPLLLGLLSLLLLWLRPPPLRESHELGGCPRLPLLTWLAALKAQKPAAPLWIGLARNTRRAAIPRTRVARALASAIADGAISSVGKHQLLCFGLGAPSSELRRRLIVAGGGCLQSLELEAVSGPAQALARVAALLGADRQSDPVALRALFRRQFPEGRILDAERGALRRVDPATLRAVSAEISGHAPARRRGALDIAVYAPSGIPRLVFAMDRAAPAVLRADFRRLALQASLADTASI